jgi:predicted Rossmann-fold nucleotide-binding protein
MGVVADAALGEGGEVHGVITRALEEKEIAHRDLVIVEADPALMIDRLRSWVPVTVDKWLDRSER